MLIEDVGELVALKLAGGQFGGVVEDALSLVVCVFLVEGEVGF